MMAQIKTKTKMIIIITNNNKIIIKMIMRMICLEIIITIITISNNNNNNNNSKIKIIMMTQICQIWVGEIPEEEINIIKVTIKASIMYVWIKLITTIIPEFLGVLWFHQTLLVNKVK